MESTFEFIAIFGMAIFGVLFFTCLEQSLKTEKKFYKILFLMFAVVCGAVTMECILRLTTEREHIANFLDILLLICMRTMQGSFILIGVLISLGIALKPKTQ